jgi:hypothetical protein
MKRIRNKIAVLDDRRHFYHPVPPGRVCRAAPGAPGPGRPQARSSSSRRSSSAAPSAPPWNSRTATACTMVLERRGADGQSDSADARLYHPGDDMTGRRIRPSGAQPLTVPTHDGRNRAVSIPSAASCWRWRPISSPLDESRTDRDHSSSASMRRATRHARPPIPDGRRQ